MKTKAVAVVILAAALLLSGCSSTSNNKEKATALMAQGCIEFTYPRRVKTDTDGQINALLKGLKLIKKAVYLDPFLFVVWEAANFIVNGGDVFLANYKNMTAEEQDRWIKKAETSKKVVVAFCGEYTPI